MEEALWCRDLYREVKFKDLPEELDMQTNNPYLKNGLAYPIPDRLIGKPEKPSMYGYGQIVHKGPQSYGVWHNKDYYCACPTYEYAWYIREKLNECDWDKSKLPEIKKGYPEWYTWLMNFYKYIMPAEHTSNHKEGWIFNLTPKQNGKLEQLRFNRLEDALWERDLYVKYNFDVELVVYYADDQLNPYYDMRIPPYPQRKIRRIHERESRQEELTELAELIKDNPWATLQEFCQSTRYNEASIRNWLRYYDTNIKEFRRLVLSGEDIWSVLELKPIIYNPDLTVYRPNNGYIHINRRNKGDVVYNVARNRTYYCCYPTRELAEKAVKELERVGWDKSKIPEINEKLGFQSRHGSRRWIYPTGYGKFSVRHKNKARKMVNFGTYKSYDKAVYVRDCLLDCGWSKDLYNTVIRPEADRLFPEDNGRAYIHFIPKPGYYRISKDKWRRGKFYDLDLAILVRDLLWYNDWDWNRYDEFESLGGWIHHCIGLYESSFIKRGECQWIIKS